MYELSYSVLMPPMCLLVAILVGALIALHWRRVGLAIVFAAAIMLYGLCTPWVSEKLLIAVEDRVPQPSPAALAGAQAIAVLSADVYHGGPDGTASDVGLLTLDRLRLAAHVYRAHPLPILVTGGPDSRGGPAAATLMARALERDYGIAASWVEDRAATTYQNGLFSAAILKAHGIARVIVVTEAWHMPRAIWSFAHAGLVAVPAPTPRLTMARGLDWRGLLPDQDSFARSFYALHEMLGMAYYRLRYGAIKPAG